MSAILVAFLIYIIAPISTTVVMRRFWSGPRTPLLTLIGLATGPMLVALLQYILLAVIPNQQPWLYPMLLYTLFLSLAFWARSEIRFKILPLSWKWLRMGELFVGCVMLFVFVRMAAYPPTWGDVYEYIEQGYVYSQDRALWRLNDPIPFSLDSTYYIMNPAIRPGIPMLYSLFFMVSPPTPYVIILTHLVYFYYLVVLVATVLYGGQLLGLKGAERVWPAGLLLSSFYVLRFTILGGKEIVLMTLALLSLYTVHAIGGAKSLNWKYLVVLGIPMGLMCLINFSGTIIALLLGMVFLLSVRLPVKVRLWAATVLVALTLIFGGLEPWAGLAGFIFNPNPLSPKSAVVDASKLKQAELQNYGLAEGDLLLRGKLQAFTQPQFFGLIFIIWLVLVVTSWYRGEKWSRLEKLLMLYVSVYFVIVMDPLSLNPHPYAYVLSISPKYSLMLVPMLAVMIAGRRETARYLVHKIPRWLIYSFAVFGLLLLPKVRNVLVGQMWEVLSNLLALTRDAGYYLALLNSLMIVMGIAGLILCLSARYWQKHYGKLLALGLLIVPTLVLINTNFGIGRTLFYLFAPLPTKMIKGEVDQQNRVTFQLVQEINEQLPTEAPIKFSFADNRISFFITNRQRLQMPTRSPQPRVPAMYIIDKNQDGSYTIRKVMDEQK